VALRTSHLLAMLALTLLAATVVRVAGIAVYGGREAGAVGAIANTPPLRGDLAAAVGVLQRVMPQLAPQIHLELSSDVPRGPAGDGLRIWGEAGSIHVRAATVPTLLYGVAHYLRSVAQLDISTNGLQLGAPGLVLPAPPAPIELAAPYRWRYALNENTDGYTTPYWDEARWQREIDLLALSGINAMLLERGTDQVYYQAFREAGYGDDEIRGWITQPAHQNWQLMGNMCCFLGPISSELLARRAASAQHIAAMLRALGIMPVLMGYYGVVPADFATRHPEAHVVPQGQWNGFERPGWLDPRDPWFARIAEAFYRHQRELLGSSLLYDMQVFQEGGDNGDVPLAPGARAIQAALRRAEPQASWMLMAWIGNPRSGLLAAVDRSRLLIADIEQGRTVHDDRDARFQGAPWLFGGLWEFGGRTTLGAPLFDYAQRLPRVAAQPGSGVRGIALYTEGLDTNPLAFELYTEMAWHSGPVQLAPWVYDYVTRRYGVDDPHAQRAWAILLDTAYSMRADAVDQNGERDAPHDSLFAAEPSLTSTHAATWSPPAARYELAALRPALAELLQVAPPLRATETWRYDVVDVGRQVLANESRILLPMIAAAFKAGNRVQMHALTAEWLRDMDLQEKLLATDGHFLLGAWLAPVPEWASNDAERAVLEYDARSILTSWGERAASQAGGLHDYANRDWAGLVGDYYRGRWQRYFASLETALAQRAQPEVIDWYAVADEWNRRGNHYLQQPRGDAYAVAGEVARILGMALPAQRAPHDRSGLRPNPRR
jgi:alpha-N-acetylglucosaminidase